MSPTVSIKVTPDNSDMLADCQEGDTKWVKLMVTSNDGQTVRAVLEEVGDSDYGDRDGESEDEVAEPDTDAGDSDADSGMPKAVVMIMGKAKKK